MSPELLDPIRFGFNDSRPTEESDCYALGMVILEVLSGQVPFTRDCNEFMVMRKVVEGERPGRPRGTEGWFTNDLWGMLELCWSPKPESRPTIKTILERLEQASTAWKSLSPSVDDVIQMDADDKPYPTANYPRKFPHFI